MFRFDLHKSLTLFQYNFDHFSLISSSCLQEHIIFLIEEFEATDSHTMPYLNFSNFALYGVYFYPFWYSEVIIPCTCLTIGGFKRENAIFIVFKNSSDWIIVVRLFRV